MAEKLDGQKKRRSYKTARLLNWQKLVFQAKKCGELGRYPGQYQAYGKREDWSRYGSYFVRGVAYGIELQGEDARQAGALDKTASHLGIYSEART